MPYVVRASHASRGRFKAEIEPGNVATAIADRLRTLGYDVTVTGSDDKPAHGSFADERGAEAPPV